jgi:hypothetical protein
MPPRGGAKGVGEIVAHAKPTRIVENPLDPIDPAPGYANLHGVKPGAWKEAGLVDEFGLPKGCPVRPVGVCDDLFFFIDTLGQLRSLKPIEFGQKHLTGLFAGRSNFLYWAWPRMTKDGTVDNFRAELVTKDLQDACARRGLFTNMARVRGRGAWRGDDGDLILHCGDKVWAGGHWILPGEHAGSVYPARPGVPGPMEQEADTKAADDMLALLQTWNWVRAIDARLMLGWIAAAMLGGALRWRPAIWITGDKATGKSTLQSVIAGVMGGAIVSTTDTTAAGIYQSIGFDSLPVAVDEIEAKADNRRAQAVVELFRVAASGGLMLRGGSEHKGVSFNARSCFAFSSINAAPLRAQDRSRMAMLTLRSLTHSGQAPKIEVEWLVATGRLFLRRLLDQWWRFDETFESYRHELAQVGHDARGQDTFGTLLACADLLLADEYSIAGASTIAAGMRAEGMAEYEDALPNWKLCIQHVMSTTPRSWEQSPKISVGKLLQGFNDGIEGRELAVCRNLLARAGLGLSKPTVAGERWALFVPNSHPQLYKLFEGTDWQGSPGVPGIWAHALRQGPPEWWRECREYIDGSQVRGTAMLFDAFLDDTPYDQRNGGGDD